MKTTTLPAAIALCVGLLGACTNQARVETPDNRPAPSALSADRHTTPSDPAATLPEQPSQPKCTSGETRPHENGCDTWTCDDAGKFVSSALAKCDAVNDVFECKPGQTRQTVPQQDAPIICDMEPPTTACPAGTSDGSDGSCYDCIPNAADRSKHNECTCSDLGHWTCVATKR